MFARPDPSRHPGAVEDPAFRNLDRISALMPRTLGGIFALLRLSQTPIERRVRSGFVQSGPTPTAGARRRDYLLRGGSDGGLVDPASRDRQSLVGAQGCASRGGLRAYYSVFSIGPLILIAIAIAGLVFGAEAVRGQVFGTLKGLLGDSGSQAIEAMLKVPTGGRVSSLPS